MGLGIGICGREGTLIQVVIADLTLQSGDRRSAVLLFTRIFLGHRLRSSPWVPASSPGVTRMDNVWSLLEAKSHANLSERRLIICFFKDKLALQGRFDLKRLWFPREIVQPKDTKRVFSFLGKQLLVL